MSKRFDSSDTRFCNLLISLRKNFGEVDETRIRDLLRASSDSAVVVPDSTGLVHAKAIGSATVTASSGGEEGARNVLVAVTFSSITASLNETCAVSSDSAGYEWAREELNLRPHAYQARTRLNGTRPKTLKP